jgi:hypothetical protein
MPPPKSTAPTYESLLNEVDKLGKVNRLRLQNLSKQIKLSEESWQSLAPFLIPEGMRQKLLGYSWSLEDRRNLGLIINVPICLQDPSSIRNKSELSIEMIEIGWESGLTEGPTSARIAVEGYYGENKRPPDISEEKLWIECSVKC